MSLTSTARDRFVNAIPISLKTTTAVVAGLAIALWIGIAISGAVTPDTAVSNADRDAYFLYINTGALDGIASSGDEPPHRPSGPR